MNSILDTPTIFEVLVNSNRWYAKLDLCFHFSRARCTISFVSYFLGTLRPDLIESASGLASGNADVIKTHHNDTDLVRQLRQKNKVIIIIYFLNSRLTLQFVPCHINIFCHQLTQITKTDFKVLNFRTICVNLCKFDEISHHILGWLVTKYVHLTKNNLYHIVYLLIINKLFYYYSISGHRTFGWLSQGRGQAFGCWFEHSQRINAKTSLSRYFLIASQICFSLHLQKSFFYV